MKFDKTKVYTALNADELCVGDMVFVADSVEDLRKQVENGKNVKTIEEILSDDEPNRFYVKECCLAKHFAYLLPKPCLCNDESNVATRSVVITNTLIKEKMMTTKEVAEAMGVNARTVLRAAARCLPNKKTENGKTTFWTEKEIAKISAELKNPHAMAKRFSHIKTTSTSDVEVVKIDEKPVQQAILPTTRQELIDNIAKAQKDFQTAYAALVQSLSCELASVKRMNKLNPPCAFDYHPLRKFSIENGYEMKKVFDQNYGSVNAYHKEVWEAVYGQQIENAPWR